jgi:hypothetical protein
VTASVRPTCGFERLADRSRAVAETAAAALARDTRRLIRDTVNSMLLAGGAIELRASGVAVDADRVVAFVGPFQ